MYITLLLLVWILYVFTSFSNKIIKNSSCSGVWILYAFTSFSNDICENLIITQVWILYAFTSFSNASLNLFSSFLFEYYTFLHHSQTNRCSYWRATEFEYYTFLHHSQTTILRCKENKSLNTIRFYIILKLNEWK